MKNYKSLMSLIIFALVISFSFTARAEQIRLAVIDASNNPQLKEQAEIIANNFSGVLARSHAITLLERDEIELILNEQKINASELQNSASAVKVGQILGCQYILISSVIYEASPIIAVRVVNVKTSEIIFSDTELTDIFDNSSIIAASSRLANEVLYVLTGEQAVITEIKSDEVIINRGSSAGVRKGDLYRVYAGSSRRPINIAVIRVKDVHTDFSSAEIIKNGGNIKLLRRVDKIEAVSSEEAQTLIKNKKLSKRRPGESQNKKVSKAAPSSAKKDNNPIENYINDLDKYIKTLDKQTEAEQNDPAKHYELASNWYELANDILQDLNEFDELFQQNTFSDANSSETLYQSFKRAVNQMAQYCFTMALIFFDKSSQNGNVDAQVMAGYMYNRGLGVQQDHKKSFEYYSQAAQKGDMRAEYTLGFMYEYAEGVEQDYKKAFEYFSKAAAKGHPYAQNSIGSFYQDGKVVKRDYKKAFEWYSKAAEQNHALAQSNLGSLYKDGLGVKQDYKKAFEWYNKAAQKGEFLAIYYLGELYEHGYGVQEDMRKAIELYRRAASLGSRMAQYKLERLGAYGLLDN